MDEINELLSDQKRLAALIDQISAGAQTETASQFSAADADARLALLEAYWEKFSENDIVIQRDSESLKDRTYFAKNVFDLTVGRYLAGKARLAERIRVLRLAEPVRPSSQPAATVTTFSHQAALEKLKLPQFNGTQRDWEAFKERFESLVLNDKTMPLVVQFQHLLNCLEDEAAEKLKGIQIIATNFKTAWDTLCRRYDNTFLCFSVQMKALSSLPSASKETVVHINQLLNTTNESINTFHALERPVEHWDDILIHFVESKLAPQTRMDWIKAIESKKKVEFPKYDELKKFLEDRVRTLDLVDGDIEQTTHKNNNSNKKPVSAYNSGRKTAYSATTRTGRNASKQKCSFCSADHFIGYCHKFGNCTPAQRRQHAETARLCTNCLSSHHNIDACNSKGRCLACGAKHHTQLHEESKEVAGGSGKSTVAHALTKAVNSFAATREKTILLSTACVPLEPDNGLVMTVRALLDSGSEESFLSEHVAQSLGLKSTSVNVAVAGVGNSTTAVARKCVSATLKTVHDSNFALKFSALVLKKVTSLVPRSGVSAKLWPHLEGLTLADPHYGTPGRVDCILSSEVCAAVLLQDIRKGDPGTPIALHSVFGWVLLGAAGIPATDQERQTSSLHLTVDQELSMAITRFLETEEVPAATTLSPDEEACYEHFLNTHTHEMRKESLRFGCPFDESLRQSILS